MVKGLGEWAFVKVEGRGSILTAWRSGTSPAAAEEEENRVKTRPETNPSVPLPPSLSHRATNSFKSLLPEVPLTVASRPKAVDIITIRPLGYSCLLYLPCPSNWHYSYKKKEKKKLEKKKYWPAWAWVTRVARKNVCYFPSIKLRSETQGGAWVCFPLFTG